MGDRGRRSSSLVGLWPRAHRHVTSGPTSAKAASIQVCALLPDTKSSTRYTLFDAPYLTKSAFTHGRRLGVGPQRARRRRRSRSRRPSSASRRAPRSSCSTSSTPASGIAITNLAVSRGREGHRLRPPRRRQQGLVLRLVRQREGRQAPGQRPRRRPEGEGQVSEQARRRRAQRRHHGQQRQAVQAGLRLDPQPAVQERQVQEGRRRRPVDRLGSDQGPDDLRPDARPQRQQDRRRRSPRTTASPAP